MNARIVRRFLLAKLLPRKGKVAMNWNAPLPRVWYQNEAGEKWVPDLNAAGELTPPKGFVYQHSIFPATITETVLRLITQEDIDACPHEEVVKDHDLIDGLEGRICRACGGSQTKRVGEPWPSEWSGAGGSRPFFRSETSYSPDLVLAMCGRQRPEEAARARARGYPFPGILPFERAAIMATTSCERCLNVLRWRYGFEDGYEEGSPEWHKANTRCKFCE